MRSGGRSFGDILSTLTVAVLFLVILLLVVFSASSYQYGTTSLDGDDNSRAVLSYIVTAVRDNDLGEVTVKDYSGAPGIAIADGTTGYEQRIYLMDGRLLEEYGKAGDGIDPDFAMEIGRLEELEIRQISEHVLEIRTDLGTSYVNTLR